MRTNIDPQGPEPVGSAVNTVPAQIRGCPAHITKAGKGNVSPCI